MNNLLQEFTAGQATQSNLTFIINFMLSIGLAMILGFVYVRYGRAISNRKRFAMNFVLLCMTTTLIISIVKSSLALSLGLVGALSIVRFRSAIKDPEELSYLFMAVAIGLGLGANQMTVTLIGFFMAMGVIVVIYHFKRPTDGTDNLIIMISAKNPASIDIHRIVEILKRFCSKLDLRRFDQLPGGVEASFIIEIKDLEGFVKLKKDLLDYCSDMHISFIDNKGIV